MRASNVVPITQALAPATVGETARRFEFTVARLDRLAEPGYYYDAKQPRLAIGVTPKGGVKTFYLCKKIAGRAERIRLGGYGELKIESAREMAQTMLVKLGGGDTIDAIRRSTDNDAKTLATVFEEFLQNRRNRRGAFLSDVSKRNYRHDFENHLGDAFGKRTLARVSRDDAVGLHNRIGREHPTAANRVAALGSSLFNYAIDDARCHNGENPFARIKKFPERKRDRFLQATELPVFLKALAETPEPWRHFFALALFTGVRRGALLRAKRAEFDLDARIWRQPTSKNGEPLTIPLSNEALAIFKQIPEIAGSAYLFPSSGKTGHLVEPKTAWTDFLKRSKLAGLRMHDLRRTLGSWQAMSGASLPIIGKSLGHKSAQSTEIYARLANAPVSESVATATGAMLAAGRKGNKGAAIRKLLGGKRKR